MKPNSKSKVNSHHQNSATNNKNRKAREKSVTSKNNNIGTIPEEKDVGDNLDLEEPNSGFSDYLKSSLGMEMIRMFVVANSLVLFVTVAWPSMKESYQIIKDLIYGEGDDLEQDI